MRTSRAILFILFFVSLFKAASFAAPKGRKTGVTFDKALPADISNENFPDQIDSFDFPNANLLDLVKAVSKFTGINFIVDTTLQSKKISIIAPSPLTVAEAYKAFLSALAANGYTLVKSGAFWKVITVEKAHKENTEVYSGDYFPNTDQIITRIIKLKYINAKEFETSIKWLLSGENAISSNEGSNSIILSDYGSVIERIMKIVYEMDVPGSEEGIHILPIHYASADALAVLLDNILSAGAAKRSSYTYGSKKKKFNISTRSKTKSGGSVKLSKIIPDDRTNSLIVSANKEGLSRVKSLIKKLDVPVDAARTGGVYVYNVRYGSAEEVYNTLMGIKPSSSAQQSARSLTQSFPHRRSSFSPRGGRSSPLFENVTILANSATNSLIISAKNRYDYERVKAVLKKIDVPRDQVFIQAIIVEMAADNDDHKEFNLGGALEVLFGDNAFFKEVLGSSFAGSFAGSFGGSFGLESLKKATVGPGLILGLPLFKLLGLDSSPNQKGVPSVSDIFKDENFKKFNSLEDDVQKELAKKLGPVSADNLNAYNFPISLIRLLKTTTNVNVLSTPQLTTLDNVKAFIEVGEKAPVGLTNTIGAGGSTSQSTDREDVTLKLEITPRINPESGTVQLDIKHKFDDFSNRTPQASELKSRGVHIVTREMETQMVLSDGETAVLGGLLTDKEVKSENKVPVLGDIPVLGWLFKSSSTEKEKRNLLVFITPTIIKGERHKEQSKEILGKKLEERINFVRKHMKGRDPHGKKLQKLIPHVKPKGDKPKDQQRQKRRWFWQRDSKERPPLKEELEKEVLEPSYKEEVFIESDSEESAPLETEEESFFEEEEGAESSSEREEEEHFSPEDFQPALPVEESKSEGGSLSPGDFESAPSVEKSELEEGSLSPGDFETAPSVEESKSEEGNLSPGDFESVPSVEKGKPEEGSLSPGDFESVPSVEESKPEEENLSPGGGVSQFPL